MMHKYETEYKDLGLMLKYLSSRKLQKMLTLLYQYCMASAIDSSTPIPNSGDDDIDRFLIPKCYEIRARTIAHEHRGQINQTNINKRWEKEKRSKSKSKLKSHSDSNEPEKPPMGGPEFTDMAYNLAKSLGIKDFNKKDAANLFITLYKGNWTYHDHSLKPCSHECSNGKTCNEKSLSERYCGLYGLMYYNLFADSKLRTLFNKMIDAANWDSICDVFKIMDNVKLDGDQFVYTNLENGKMIFQFEKDVIGKAIEDYA